MALTTQNSHTAVFHTLRAFSSQPAQRASISSQALQRLQLMWVGPLPPLQW
eukprot:m.55212 g.55212  ORF g.55212 m.55212 type:complete len:51 (+) comp13293_c0_seq6:389-541(+)